jgi:hypothetical protein
MTVLEEIQQVKERFRIRRESVAADKRLSEFGRRDQMKALADERDAALLALVPKLREAAVSVGRGIERLSGAQAALNDIGKDNLNFQRLSFETGEMRASLTPISKDPDSLRQKFEAVRRSSDVYRLRAALSVIGDLVPTDPTSRASEWQELSQELSSSADLVQSPEYLRYAAEKRAMVESLHGVEVEAAELGQSLSSSRVAENVKQSIFSGLSKNEDGQLVVSFGKTAGESNQETLERLAAERKQAEIQTAEWYGRFNEPYNVLTDGVVEAGDVGDTT